MKVDLMTRAGLVCPSCRGPGACASPLVLESASAASGDEVLEGLLACSRPGCTARYPVLEGVPVVVRDLSAWWEAEGRDAIDPAPAGAALGELLRSLRRGSRAARARRDRLGCQAELHFGPARPGGEETSSDDYWRAVGEVLGAEARGSGDVALDLGCSVGRATFELARRVELAVGLDLSLEQVAWADALRRGERPAYERVLHGVARERVEVDRAVPGNALFLVGDALDPPFRASSFDRVVALNLLDSVSVPLVLLGQMDALLKPGGELVLGSPYAWREDVTASVEWLERESEEPARFVREILEGRHLEATRFRYAMVSERERITMPLRQSDRQVALFDVHLLCARRAASAEGESH